MSDDLNRASRRKIERDLKHKKVSALDICKTALIAAGAPKDEVAGLTEGRYTDHLVHYFVASEPRKNWEEAKLFAKKGVENEFN